MEISDLISIGVIKKVIGNSGKCSVIPDTLFPEQYLSLQSAFIVFPDEKVMYEKITSMKYVNNFFIVNFERINSSEKARSLINAHIMIAEDMLPVLEEDEYYPSQLTDYMVVTVDGLKVGKVKEILSTPGQEILLIPKDGKEIMIPFCDAFITEVNPEEKLIIIDPIEGLLYAY